jgi:NhaP-type Na+/H+ or K+/H+ antiporter
MLTTLIFFVVGLVIGLASLRLMSYVEAHGATEPPVKERYRHHS